MINFDDYTNEIKTEHNLKWRYKISDTRSSIQNVNNNRFWIWKNKCIIGFNKQSAILIKNIYMQKIPMKQNINI